MPFLDKGNDEEIPLALTQIALAETREEEEEEEEEEREDVEDDGDDGDDGEPLKKKRDEGDDDVVVERDVLPPLLLLTFLPTMTVRVAARAQNVFMCLRVFCCFSRGYSQRFSIQHHTSFFFEKELLSLVGKKCHERKRQKKGHELTKTNGEYNSFLVLDAHYCLKMVNFGRQGRRPMYEH